MRTTCGPTPWRSRRTAPIFDGGMPLFARLHILSSIYASNNDNNNNNHKVKNQTKEIITPHHHATKANNNNKPQNRAKEISSPDEHSSSPISVESDCTDTPTSRSLS